MTTTKDQGTRETGAALPRRAGPFVALALCLPLAHAQGTGQGQVPPQEQQNIQRRLEQERPPEAPRTIERRLPELREGTPRPAAGDAQSAGFLVRKITVRGMSLLPLTAVEPLLRPYEGRIVTVAELQALAAQIDAAYRAAGHLATKTIIPAQAVTSGDVVLEVVEGKVGRIELKEIPYTSSTYVLNRVGVDRGDVLDGNELYGKVLRFNRTNDINLAVDLQAGQESGTTDLVVRPLGEVRRQVWEASFDNFGTPSLGANRLSAHYRLLSLFGVRDELSVDLCKSAGLTCVGVGYTLPVTTRGTKLSLSAGSDQTKIVAGALTPLDISGKTTRSEVGLRHPLYSSDRHDFYVGGSMRMSKTTSTTGGQTLYTASYSGQKLSLDYNYFGERNVITASAGVGRGKVKEVAGNDFSGTRLFARWDGYQVDKWVFTAYANLQRSAKLLVPADDIFALGGPYRLRGYSPAVVSGGQGWAATAEARRYFTLGDSGQWTGSAFGFYDMGSVNVFRQPNDTKQPDVSLASVGAGVEVNYGKLGYARLMFAKGVKSVPEAEALSKFYLQVGLRL
ncbi:MAG: ShlB/FhaC/HecB family hemolysin secretion/activation protein [Pseudomonadota bacterium]